MCMWKIVMLVVRWNATDRNLVVTSYLNTRAQRHIHTCCPLFCSSAIRCHFCLRVWWSVSIPYSNRAVTPAFHVTLFFCQHAFLKQTSVPILSCASLHLSRSLVPPPQAESHPLEFYFCCCGFDPPSTLICLSISVFVALHSFLSFHLKKLKCTLLHVITSRAIWNPFFCFPYIHFFFLCHISPCFWRKLHKFHSKC